MERKDLHNLLKIYPQLCACLTQNIFVKKNDHYFFEISRCLLQILGRDWLLKTKKITSSLYFPLMVTSFDSHIYRKYYYSYSESDPLYDLIMIGSVPYLLILNSEDGRKVNIPLVPADTDILCNLHESATIYRTNVGAQ